MILIFNESNISGGSERILNNLLQRFISTGAQLCLVLNKSNPSIAPLNVNVKYVRTPFDFSPRTNKRLFLILRSSALKLVSYFTCYFSALSIIFKVRPSSVYIHSGGFPSGFLNTSAIAASLIFNIFCFRKCKLCLSIHSIPSSTNILLYLNWVLLFLNSLFARSLNFIFVSQSSLDVFQGLYLFSYFSKFCVVIRNTIDLDNLHPQYHLINDRPNYFADMYVLKDKPFDSIDLAIIGYIDSIKDQVYAAKYLFNHSKFFAEVNIKIKLHIYGSSKCQSSYVQLLNVVSLSNSTDFFDLVLHGERPTSSIPYHSFHYILSFSNIESYPLSLVESICFGTPCLCNSVGGIPEIIKSGYNGYLFDKKSFKNFDDYELLNYILLPATNPNSYVQLCTQTYLSSKTIIKDNMSSQSLYLSLICPN